MWVIASTLVYLYFRLLYRLRLFDRHHVPRRGALIYVSNHQSHYDPPLVGTAVADRPCAFLARASLFRFKPFGWFIRAFSAIPLEREKGGREALRAATGELKAGRCVLMFPEGTRTRNGALGRFRGGFVFLARRTGAAVVPVAIEGAHDVWPSGRPLPRWSGWIAVKVGAAVPADELLAEGDEAAIERIRWTIEEMRMELRAELRGVSHGRWPAHNTGEAPFWQENEQGPRARPGKG